MKTFCIKLNNDDLQDKQNMKVLQDFMDEVINELNKETNKIANELNVSIRCASDIVYLRTRSRWSEKLESELIELYKNGNPPNIYDFGCKNSKITKQKTKQKDKK